MSSGKKIIRLFSRLNIGGPAIHVINLSVGLKRYNYETILVVGTPDPGEGTLDQLAVESGAKLHIIPSFQAAISPLKDLRTFLAIFILLWREKPDVVHTHTFKAGLLGRIAAIITGVPTVVHTYHGHLLSGYRGPLGTAIIRTIETALAKFTTQIIAVSQQVADDLVAASIAPRKKVRVIELGFDMESIREQLQTAPSLRRDHGIPSDAKIVGIVGRLVSVKSVELFLRALTPLLQTHAKLYLAIVGDGVEGPALRKLAKQLTNSPRLLFCGWRRPIVPDLRDLAICVCSSRNEGTSVSIIEAVVAGVPVVSTRVGGMTDLLKNGAWGDLVEYDESALRATVESLLETLQLDPTSARRQALEQRSRDASQIFQRRFSVDRLLSEVQSLYSEIQPPESRPAMEESHGRH